MTATVTVTVTVAVAVAALPVVAGGSDPSKKNHSGSLPNQNQNSHFLSGARIGPA